MIGDGELDQTTAQLGQVQLDHTKHQERLTEVLQKYGTLIEDYKRLKSDFEEERDSRERYKQMARGSERNPFVLVLVDGDGYIFDDNLVSNKDDGGQRAAQLLDGAVKASLRAKSLEHCRVMVRVYANLVGLSKALSRAKLSGPEKRSLAPFVANFNRTNDLYDFVDAGELKENADSKLRSMWRLFVENSQCKHIFFAGCHDVGYINELTPYQNSRDKITLVQTYAFHPEFRKLGMNVEDFHGVFRRTPLDAGNASTPMNQAPQSAVQSSTPAIATSSEHGDAKVCFFYQKGKCSYGSACKNLHIKASSAGNAEFATTARPKAQPKPQTRPDMSNTSGTRFTSNADIDFMRGSNANTSAYTTSADIHLLPTPEKIPPGMIAVNKDDHRLDPVYPYTPEDRATFTQRVANQKLCNQWHINGHCPGNFINCPYDHNSISEGVRNCLRSVAFNTPCKAQGECRNVACLFGHVCQRTDCTWHGGKTYCRHPESLHRIDLHVHTFVDGTGKDAAPGEQGPSPSPPQTESELDTKSTNGDSSRSLFGFSFGGARSADASPNKKNTTHDSSDEDEDEDGDTADRNGAKLNPGDSDLD